MQRLKGIMTLLLACLAFSCSTTVSETTETEERMEIKDHHTYAQPNDAVIEHLDLDIDVDFAQKVISGKAGYEIENKSGADKIYLDTRDLTIEKVTLGKTNETPAEYALGQSDPLLGAPLEITIEPTTEYINIYYRTSPNAAALQWLDPEQTAGKEHPFLFTQSQAILARSWIPIQDGPGIRFTYDAEVTVPNDLLAVMSAQNPMERNETGVYQMKMEQPIPAYLMALSVGDIVFKPIGARTGVYAEPSVVDAAAYEFADMEKMLEAAEDMYGKYAWERYDVIVLPPSFPFGGMENPRLTFATPTILAGDRSLTALIAHELAHSWSGNLVTNATWEDFWLNEGFTVYFEGRIMEELYGESYVNMLHELGYQDLQDEIKRLNADNRAEDTKLKLALEGRDPDEGLTNIAYEKGALLLRHMEEVVGRERFDQFLKNYFEEHAFETMTTEGFIEYYQSHLINDNPEAAEAIDIEAWIYGEGLPENHPVITSERFDQVEAQIERFMAGTPAAELNTTGWTTHEWRHFLRNMPEDITVAQMTQLDNAFNFTQTGNSEVAALWLEMAIEHQYETAYDELENFLVDVGRRKFLVPLYEALAQTDQGKERARGIYEKARPNYHSVSRGTIDEILSWNN